MKRRTRLICIGCALVGTLPIAAQAASASTYEPQSVSLHESSSAPVLAAAIHRAAVPQAVQAVQAVQPAIERVTVVSGDTLSGIAARTSRTWEQLAGYNHVPDPNLIHPGQVIVIPPANYTPVATATTAFSRADPPTSTAASTHVASATSDLPGSGSTGSGIWACIAQHESGGNPSTNTGNGFYGMYQDTQSSWVAGGGLAYAPRADEASVAAQTTVNERIQAQQGWGAWPNTSVMCGA